MKKIKRILAVVLTGILVLGIAAGCASKKDDNSSSSAGSSEKSTGKSDEKDNDKSSDKDSDKSKEKTKISFVLDWTPNTNHTGLYVAQEKGYFSDAGLEVEIVQPPEDGAEMLVGANKAQFGVSFQDSMLPAVAGDNAMPIEAVAAVVQHNTSGIISLKGKGMDKPKGLEGKKYATWDMPIEKATLKQVVEADGGDFPGI